MGKVSSIVPENLSSEHASSCCDSILSSAGLSWWGRGSVKSGAKVLTWSCHPGLCPVALLGISILRASQLSGCV